MSAGVCCQHFVPLGSHCEECQAQTGEKLFTEAEVREIVAKFLERCIESYESDRLIADIRSGKENFE